MHKVQFLLTQSELLMQLYDHFEALVIANDLSTSRGTHLNILQSNIKAPKKASNITTEQNQHLTQCQQRQYLLSGCRIGLLHYTVHVNLINW